MRSYMMIGMGCLLLALGAFAQTPVEALNDKVDRLDRELTLLQRKLYQTPEAIEARPKKRTSRSFSLFGDNHADEESTEGSSAGSLDELFEQLETQGRLIQDLTAKLEEQAYRLEQLSSLVDVLNKDVDLRFQQLKNKPSSSGNTSSETKPKTDDDKAAYDAAYALLKKGEYAEAEQAFINFMKMYPKSQLVGNANYWLGETYYVRGLYEQAVGIFADGFTTYKQNTKAPDNLLKLGLTMKQLKKTEEACTAFKTLPSEFPKAPDTLKKRAEEEAKKLACPA